VSGVMTLRQFATSRSYCGLDASPLMAAIYDASDGVRPTTIDDTTSLAHFGCSLDALPSVARRTVAIRAGGRAGKSSRLMGVKALHAAWTVPLPTLRRGEVASAMLIAPDLSLARQTLSFVSGYVDDSALLRRALIDEPTKDAIDLRRPDGKRVRVEVRAATRGGRGARGRTLVFAGLDEAAFFFDEATGVVNDSDIYRAVAQRVVPGGQVWVSSTPWLADTGLLETTIAKNWGTHEHALVVTAGTRALNPTWDPTGEIERDLREQDPDAAIREIDGEPLAGGSGAFFDAAAISACVEDLVLPWPASACGRASFGADLAFVSDSSSLVGVADVDGKLQVVALDEKRPSKGHPLRPKAVIDSFAEAMRAFGAKTFMADGHYRESAKEHLDPHDIQFRDAPGGRDGKSDVYLHAKKLIHEARVRIPNLPRLVTQLRQVVSRPMPGGGIAITVPRRKGAGHGDIVSAFVLALWQANRAPAAISDVEKRLMQQQMERARHRTPDSIQIEAAAALARRPLW
jgi:hypothetical protein